MDKQGEQRQEPPPGWYDDPQRPGILRYWANGQWDDSIPPRPKPDPPQPAWKGARVIALGILIACAAVWFIYNLTQPTELDCSLQRLEYTTGDRPIYEVDDSCR